MYKLVKNIDTSDYLYLLENRTWKEVRSDDRLFYTHMLDLDGYERSFLLKIPPGGNVHRHTDTPRPEKTYHIPLQTNEYCVNYTYNPDTETHLEIGKLYEIDRQIEHDSFNRGLSDRIHLIIETIKNVI